MNKKENKKELLDEVRRIANSLEPAALWLLDHPCGFGKTKWSDNSCTSAEDMAAWMVSVPDDLREAVGTMSRKRTLILESRQILPILRKISSASSLDSGAHYPLDPFLLPSSKESISDSSWLKAHQSTRG
ncbi:hypothetical protein [uncultured Phocaeicola sp.]|nr:hypothetical protein [uncultured Phocaeicola sp.]